MSDLSVSVQNLSSSEILRVDDAQSSLALVPATQYTVQELTNAYNQTRIDYIVPMPMNVSRLCEYIQKYDVSLEDSAVAVADGQMLGLAMLGVRPDHTWVTRLGVLPGTRRRGAGEKLMRYMIERARMLDVDYVDLEVIKNNKPAHRLFKKLGFYETRELLIMRRPPGPPTAEVKPYSLRVMGHQDAVRLLAERRSQPSWLDETPSLINVGGMSALEVRLDDGSWGWLVYKSTVFQLSYMVFQTEVGCAYEVARALVHALHSHHPVQDTKTENLPADDPHLPGLLDMGYLESFRRIEMHLDFK